MADEQIVGLAELRAKLGTMKSHAADPAPALQWSGEAVAHSGIARIEAGGPGWPPNVGGTPLLNRTGGLIAALQPAQSVHVEGGTATITPAGKYGEIGYWLQEGTGIYGDRGTPIVPTSAKVLHFMLGGEHVFAHSIKGTPKREFLSITGPLKALIEDAFARWLTGNPLPPRYT